MARVDEVRIEPQTEGQFRQEGSLRTLAKTEVRVDASKVL